MDPDRARGHLAPPIRVGYLPRFFNNTNRNEGGLPLVPDGELRASLAPSVNITQVANFGSGYILLDMTTRPVQATYSTSVFKNKHSFKFGADAMGVYFLYNRYEGPQSGSYSFSSLANSPGGALYNLHAELRARWAGT